MSAANAKRAIVLFDGQCPLCRKTTAILKRFDWLHLLSFHDCRDEAGIPTNTAGLKAERMVAEMHVLSADRKNALSGYQAVRWIAARVPLLWPFVPYLFIPGMPKIGQRIYVWVARNRFQLVPCHDGVCTIPPN